MRLEIYVPKEVGDSTIIKDTERRMNSVFGGSTTIDGNGSWTNDRGEVINEEVTIVYSFADERKWLPHVVHQVGKDMSNLVKVELKQETVLYAVDNKGVFI